MKKIFKVRIGYRELGDAFIDSFEGVYNLEKDTDDENYGLFDFITEVGDMPIKDVVKKYARKGDAVWDSRKS